ncbi:MAG: hypothetical protein NZ959_10155 [Armatimonadetes bacterium]|nr:hypothetical protein [Armatimonadota bacterium]MDW8121941.1 hypothetical protein [Armatimonadota bacterium]
MQNATDFWIYLTLFALGAYHGINPAMGWLFAVALGLQERSQRSVFLALIPITIGHALSIALVIGILVVARQLLPTEFLRFVIGIILIGFGLIRLWRPRHLRWVGMRLSKWELTWWSFLAATAHGAGLMVTPLALCLPQGQIQQTATLFNLPLGELIPLTGSAFLAVIVHTVGMLTAMALTAGFIYARFGLALLRQWWFNFDLIWGLTLILAGTATLIWQ